MKGLEKIIERYKGEGFRISLRLGEREIGRCYIYLIRNDLHQKPYALLEDVWIEERYRGRGYGKELVKEALKLAKELGCYKIIATSRFGRVNVHRFYEKLGFKRWGYEFRIDFE